MGRVRDRRVGVALASVAVMVAAASPAVGAHAESAAHTSSTPTANRVRTFGFNDFGALGDGTINSNIATHFSLPRGENPVEARAGEYHSLVRTASGAIYAAGVNEVGQLGDGTTIKRNAPVKVSLPAGVTATAIGPTVWTSIAIGSDGKIYAWGDNYYGEVGDGTSGTTPVTTPVAISLPGGAVPAAVASTRTRSFALSTAGQIYAWPYRGALTPTLMVGQPAKTFVQIASSKFAVYVRASDGTAYGWSAFSSTPGSDGPSTPVAMPGGLTIKDIAVGLGVTIAIGSDDHVYSWGGDDSSGALGNGTTYTTTLTPVPVSLPAGVTVARIGMGWEHAFALTTSGAVYGWGSNDSNALGVPFQGTSSSIPTPIPIAQYRNEVPIAMTGGSRWTLMLVDDTTPSEYVPVQPERLLDTRTPEDGPSLAPGEEIALDVTGGVSDIPLDAVAVTLNVTGTEPDAPGYLTVWPCDSPRPVASNVNLAAGETAPNLVIAKMASDGTVCIFSQAGAHVIVDLQGWFPWSTSYQPLTPTRVLDTRSPGAIGYAGPKPTTGQTITLPVRGIGPVPNDAGAVVLNVTATEASGAGFVTVWPCDRPRPTASNLNVPAGGTRPNSVVAKVSAAGTVCLFTQAGTHLIADVQGSFPTGSTFQPLQPERLLDTRTPGLIGYFGGKPVAGQTVTLQVTGVGTSNLPGTTSAVVLNVTGTDASGGYVTVWPCDQPRPLASNLNLAPGDTRPNLVIAKTSAAGSVCLFTSGSTHLIADLAGAW